MATQISALITQVRTEINEPTASYWTDAELLQHAIDGIKDLWKTVKNVLQDHFFTVDASSMSILANTALINGVPTDVAEIRNIEPADLATYPSIVFKPKKYNDPEFANARAQTAMDPNTLAGVIYYAMTGAGGPVGAPNIYTAPLLTTTLPLSVQYVPNVGALTSSSNNPIPGESDYAVKCWMKAHALGRQNQDGIFEPDAAWMELYGNEKEKIRVAITPRQTQEPEVAEALFEPYW